LTAICWNTARADEDRPASKGIYAEGALGATTFLGDADAAAEIGPAMAIRVGYDLFSWFSVGGHLTASTHEATVPPPPEGEYFQLYTAIAEGRLGFRYGRIGAFVDGGAGIGMISSNVWSKVGLLEPNESLTLAVRAGGGFEYQLQNRHYAFGLDGEWSSYAAFENTQSVTVRTFIRYTY